MMRNMPLATQSEMIMRRIAEDQKAGVVGSVIPKDMTMRQNMVSGMQQMLIDNTGMDNARARKLSETMFGGENSGIPLGIGLIDLTPFVIPLAAQEAGISAGEAREAAQAGEYGQAALSYGTGVLQGLDVVPGVALAAKGAKALGEALAPAAADVMEKYLTKTGAILKMAPDSPGIEVKSAPKLNTPAFKNWFGDSKVVDDKGQPLVVYHGTDAEFDVFDRKKQRDGRLGKGFYFTSSPEEAKLYGKNVMPVYLQADRLYNGRTGKAIGNGKTSAVEYSLTADGGRVFVVYDPKQIKSVFNKGTFDPKDPRILYGGGAAGVATAGEEKK
jgi:hypothetical protein